MSKSAVAFLTLLVMSLAALHLAPASSMVTVVIFESAAAVFAFLFVAALLVGRRIKFDPVLRQPRT